MTPFLTIIKSDYLQRTRSYAFLIILCISLAVAYTFVPAPTASYSTIRIADHVGYYNAAWFGYVTAIMTSVFLSLIGFYLVNSSIKTDLDTKVGQIIAATGTSNRRYLFSKVFSNFLVLITIELVVFVMSIILFFLYNDGFSFEILPFIKPYLIITTPTLFFIATLAVTFEVFFGKYRILHNVGYFFLFSFLMAAVNTEVNTFSMDLFGSKIVLEEFEQTVKGLGISDTDTVTSIGFVFTKDLHNKKFLFEGMDFPALFLLSRLVWMLVGGIIIWGISPFFNRFNTKVYANSKTKIKQSLNAPQTSKEILLSNLPVAKHNYAIFPLLKTEIVLLLRKGKKWMWLINVIGVVLLTVLPLPLAHKIVLPILWFLQVGRLPDLTLKGHSNNVEYMIRTSFKPIRRVFVVQLLACIALMLTLAIPLLIRLGLSANLLSVFAICSGGVFIVMLASLLGLLSKGKKLFEVFFFMLTYANINGITILDYFGAYASTNNYLSLIHI